MKNELEIIRELNREDIKLLGLIGINKLEQLLGQNPEALFEKICRKTELQHDLELKEQLEKAIKIVEEMPVKSKPRKRNPQLLS